MAGGEKDNSTFLQYDLTTEIRHGMAVSRMAYYVSKALGMDEDFCYQMAIAGVVHDIGKLRLTGYIYGKEGQNPLAIEELKYVRMHSTLGYESLKEQGGYSRVVLESVHYHHENFDGTGYPDNLSGEDIPLGARILRVCDVYCALRTDRPYRRAFDQQTTMELMIEEVKNFDMRVFIAFQRVVHEAKGGDNGAN